LDRQDAINELFKYLLQVVGQKTAALVWTAIFFEQGLFLWLRLTDLQTTAHR